MTGYLRDKMGGGWLGYRGVFAVLVGSPQFALQIYWISYANVSLSTGLFYLTLLPMMAAVALIGLLPGRSGITPRALGTYAIWALLPFTLYDWARIPMNLYYGIPFWDHWFDWGASVMGVTSGTIFRYDTLLAGVVSHAIRGWGFAMAFYILVRRVTLVSAFAFAWVMTALYWAVFPVWVLTDSLPPWVWWFVAWSSHMVFAMGLWLAPKITEYYRGVK